ncbi:unnamed protein product, partial [Ectocarpus sp. 8 AP-2014]
RTLVTRPREGGELFPQDPSPARWGTAIDLHDHFIPPLTSRRRSGGKGQNRLPLVPVVKCLSHNFALCLLSATLCCHFRWFFLHATHTGRLLAPLLLVRDHFRRPSLGRKNNPAGDSSLQTLSR